MADLISDSSVAATGVPGRYAASLSPEWAVWGPNGGYLAAIALRAAMAESRLPRAASFHCHFLAAGEFAPVELEVTSLGGGRRAESLRVDMRQGEKLLLAATVWMVDAGLQGFEHGFVRPPEVSGAEALASFADRAGDEYANWYPIWRSIEGRPTSWNEPPGEPEWNCWLRFVDTPIEDENADAVRQLFWLDMPGWNATIAAHPWPFRYFTPNLDLNIQFHSFAPEETWMLAHGTVPVAKDGVLGCVSRLFTADGRLLATGASKHVCRPNAGYEAELERARAQGDLSPEDSISAS